MTEQDKDFQRKKLDQQIEQPARYLDVKAGHLVEDLQRMYRLSNHDSRADAESLRRVRSLLESRLRQSRQDANTIPFERLRKHHERKTMMIENTEMPQATRKQKAASERGSRRNRLTRFLSTIAAVLVVAVLIGSAVLLFNAKKGSPGSTTSQVVSTPKASPSPTSQKLDCSHIFSSGGWYPDNGEHAVCMQRLETALGYTATVTGHKVTLISAYADANRLLIKFSVAGRNDTTADGYLDTISSTIQNDIKLPLITVSDNYYDAHRNETLGLAKFDMQSVPAGVKTLQVTADFSSWSFKAQKADSTTFRFTLPVQTAKRVSTPNARGSINGHGITMTHVIVTPSLTIIDLKSDQKLNANGAVNLQATINGSKVQEVDAMTDAPGNGKQGKVTGWEVLVQENLIDTQGTWTLRLQSTGLPLGTGNEEISFTVPASA